MQELLLEVGNELRVATPLHIVGIDTIKVLQVLDTFINLVFIGAVFIHRTCVKVASGDNAFGHLFHSHLLLVEHSHDVSSGATDRGTPDTRWGNEFDLKKVLN
jgi:hypothetical protein